MVTADRLASGGRAVLNLQPPTEPVSVPEVLASAVEVGHRRYEGWARAEPNTDEPTNRTRTVAPTQR